MGPYDSFINQAASKHRVPVLVIKAIITIESSWKPQATSVQQAVGLMQVIPPTAQLMGYKGPIGSKDRLDGLYAPATNIDIGTKYLAWNWHARRIKNWEDAAAAYFAGSVFRDSNGRYSREKKDANDVSVWEYVNNYKAAMLKIAKADFPLQSAQRIVDQILGYSTVPVPVPQPGPAPIPPPPGTRPRPPFVIPLPPLPQFTDEQRKQLIIVATILLALLGVEILLEATE